MSIRPPESRKLVQFKDGSREMHEVFLYEGACLVGDPTAYIQRGSITVWVKPGASVDFIEA